MPQPGYQYQFLTSRADIVIGGGAAGSGKTSSLLLDILKAAMIGPQFGGIVFRRTYPEIMQVGGLWDESKKLYPYAGAAPTEGRESWKFKEGGKVVFSHLQYEKDLIHNDLQRVLNSNHRFFDFAYSITSGFFAFHFS